MSLSQYYRLSQTWKSGEWPMSFDTETIGTLNEVTQSTWSITMHGGTEKVERYEYVGEGPESDSLNSLADAVVGGDE